MRYPRSRRALTPPTCLNAYSSKGRMLHAWCPVAGAKQIRGELDRLLAGRNSDGAKFVSVVDFGATLQLSSPGDGKPRARWTGTAAEASAILASLPDRAGVTVVRATLGLCPRPWVAHSSRDPRHSRS